MKITFIGGMSRNFPFDQLTCEWEHIDQDEANRRSIAGSPDVVLVLKDFVSHKAFDRLKSEAKKMKIPFVYARGGFNRLIQAAKLQGHDLSKWVKNNGAQEKLTELKPTKSPPPRVDSCVAKVVIEKQPPSLLLSTPYWEQGEISRLFKVPKECVEMRHIEAYRKYTAKMNWVTGDIAGYRSAINTIATHKQIVPKIQITQRNGRDHLVLRGFMLLDVVATADVKKMHGGKRGGLSHGEARTLRNMIKSQLPENVECVKPYCIIYSVGYVRGTASKGQMDWIEGRNTLRKPEPAPEPKPAPLPPPPPPPSALPPKTEPAPCPKIDLPLPEKSPVIPDDRKELHEKIVSLTRENQSYIEQISALEKEITKQKMVIDSLKKLL